MQRLPLEIETSILLWSGNVHPVAKLVKDVHEARRELFRSDYYDNYLDAWNPADYFENPVCGLQPQHLHRFGGEPLEMDDEDYDELLNFWGIGPCGICPKCVNERLNHEVAMFDERLEKWIAAHPLRPSTLKNDLDLQIFLLQGQGYEKNYKRIRKLRKAVGATRSNSPDLNSNGTHGLVHGNPATRCNPGPTEVLNETA